MFIADLGPWTSCQMTKRVLLINFHSQQNFISYEKTVSAAMPV